MSQKFTFNELIDAMELSNSNQKITSKHTTNNLIIQTTLDNLLNICQIDEPESGLHLMDAPGISKILIDFFNYKISLENALKELEKSLYMKTLPPNRFLICLLIMGWKLPIYNQFKNKWIKEIKRNTNDYCQISFCLGRIITYFDFKKFLKTWSYENDKGFVNKIRFNDIIYQIIQRIRLDLQFEYLTNNCSMCKNMEDLLSVIQDWLL